MAYADLLDEEGVYSQYLVVIKPRRYVWSEGWSLVTGTKYSQSFFYGQVVRLQKENTLLTLASSSALSDGDWFYDEEASLLYIDVAIDVNGIDIIATYEIYVGTFDAHFNRDPLDPTTRQVYFEPLVLNSPQIQSSSSDIVFGFLPSQSTSIQISNLTQFLQGDLYDSSFNRCEVAVYHYLDELITENVKLVNRGICGSITADDQTVNITIYDNNDLFNAEFRHPGLESFYAMSDFANLDPNFQARPIRKVYGVVDGYVPVNISYKLTNPTTSDNRTWICFKPHTNLNNVSTTPLVSPASTTTRTYVASANGIRAGDSVWIDSALGAGSDGYVIVTVVNKTGSHYIEHAAIATPATSADVVKRSFVGNVTLYKEGVAYQAFYGKHYTNYVDTLNSVAGFSFSSNLETDYSIAPIGAVDLVYARVYGNTNVTTLGGLSFGSDSLTTLNLTHPIVILFSLLKDYLGIDESALDLVAFDSLSLSIDDEIGFAIPEQSNQNFPAYKDLLSTIVQSILLKVFIDDDNKFSIAQTGPYSTVSKTIADDEIMDSSFKYSFDYRDVRSDFFVQFAAREVSFRSQFGGDYYSLVGAVSNVAKRLHQIQKQQTFTSLHFLESDAQTLANRLSYALGERQGTITLRAKTRFFNSQIDELIQISRTKIPGFSYDSDTLRQRSAVISSQQKSLTEIVLSMDDQKGIQDNSANW